MDETMTKTIALRACRATVSLLFIVSAASARLHAQEKPKEEPDIVVFSNGEKLIGHFESSSGGSAKFKSDTIGEVTIDLSKVQKFHTSQKFAVIRKNLKLRKDQKDGQVPRGTISVADQKVAVNPGNGQPERFVAISDMGNIVDEASFDAAFRSPGIFHKWTGAITFGTALVEATQNSLSVTSGVSLVRAIPTENWLPLSNRTAIDFSDTYGKVSQPGEPTLKTSIYHADAERDEYFTTRLYALGTAAFDHNFSQGLDLQQIYGGGIGWTAMQRPNQSLDFKASIDYEKQQFEVAAQNQNLANSIFAEYYKLKFAHNIQLNEQFSVSPAWTYTRAYSAYASVGIIFPVYKRFAFTANAINSFLNDPPPGFKKNSTQFTTGLSYTLP
jgi:hypothetical protein